MLIYMTLDFGKETAFDKKEVLVEVSSSFFEKKIRTIPDCGS